MTPDAIAAFDQTRKLAGKAVRSICYAPHTNLFFGMNGDVRVCCWNQQFPIGDARSETLDAIWTGARARQLRRALEDYDLRHGCTFCEQQVADGMTMGTAPRTFDRFAVAAADPQWPRRMEFSISNSCNLECVMCSGTFSSAIRAHRERLPPAEKAYSSAFIESLRPYLPHLDRAKFLGGEPFLISEYWRIWDIMVEDAPHVACHITTNGTQYNQRVEAYMNKLNFSFAVSLDGATKATVESIRVGADFGEQMAILQRLRDYTDARKTDLSLTFCFMRQNWHEFGEFCLLADHWRCAVGVNTVSNPPQFSLHALPPEQLRPIVAAMATQAPRLESALKQNRGVWFAEFERLRRICDRATDPAAVLTAHGG